MDNRLVMLAAFAVLAQTVDAFSLAPISTGSVVRRGRGERESNACVELGRDHPAPQRLEQHVRASITSTLMMLRIVMLSS